MTLEWYNCILPIWLWDWTNMTLCWRDMRSASHWISHLSSQMRAASGHTTSRWSWSLCLVWSPPVWPPEVPHRYQGPDNRLPFRTRFRRTKFSSDKIFRRTKFSTPSPNFDTFVQFLPDFCIEILDKIFDGQNFSSGKIFDTKQKFR